MSDLRTSSTPPPTPPRRAKLELLVRPDDNDENFEIREIGSATAFVQSRPQRVAPESFELAEGASRVAGQRHFILKNTKTDRYLMLTEPEKFLWEQMDGRTSLQEIATAYVLRYGAFDFDVIPNLIRKLQRAQLLTLTPSSRLRQALARNRRKPVVKAIESGFTVLERINISSRNVHRVFAALYRYGGFLLFTRGAVVVLALLALAGLVVGVRLWQEGGSGRAPRPSSRTSVTTRSWRPSPSTCCCWRRWRCTSSCTVWPSCTTTVGCASSASRSCTVSCRRSTWT